MSEFLPQPTYTFFCNAAASYLQGSFWETPYSCYEIQKNQPEFFEYLKQLFGPKSGFLNQCFSYHGFNFNTSQMDDLPHYQDVCNECIRQVNYTESTGVSQNIMDFFKTVPLTLKPDYQTPDHYCGLYLDPIRSVILKSAFFYQNQQYGFKDQTLLHECLHAFHDQCILNSFNNPYIFQFFQDAVQHRYYYDSKDGSDYFNYWMTNQFEFFACTAMAFLNDYAPYEPFGRRNICKYQPDYYLYLQGIFGTKHDDIDIVERSLLSNAADNLY